MTQQLCPLCGKNFHLGACEKSPGVGGIQVTDVQRLALKGGDRLIARVDRAQMSTEEAAQVREMLRARLQLDESIQIVVVTREWSFTVVGGDA